MGTTHTEKPSRLSSALQAAEGMMTSYKGTVEHSQRLYLSKAELVVTLEILGQELL